MSLRENLKDYNEKREKLAEVSKRDRAETPEYEAANKAVADAEKKVPWALRW